MTITRADVASLKPGDVVEYTQPDWPAGSVWRGPLYAAHGCLYVTGMTIRATDGRAYRPDGTLTVISRAKPPLYVNSDKTEPDPGDVVRDAESTNPQTWTHSPISIGSRTQSNPWRKNGDPNGEFLVRNSLPTRLRLLVDGRTGQVVQ